MASEMVGKKRVNILMLSQFAEVGGLEKMALSLTHYLQKDYSASFFSYDGLCDLDLVTKYNIPKDQFIFQRKKRGFCLFTLMRVARIILSKKISIVHTHDRGPLFYASLANFLLLGRVKIIHTQHSLVVLKREGKIASLLEKFFMKHLKNIVSVSKSLQKEMAGRGWPSTYIPNGVEFCSKGPVDYKARQKNRERFIKSSPSDFREKLERHKDKIWLTSVARIQSKKGQIEFLEFWLKQPISIRKQCLLVFAGPTSSQECYRDIVSLVASAGMEDSVVLIGNCHKVGELLQASNIFISGSQYEGMPLAVLEAIGGGLPGLLSDIDGHKMFRCGASFFNKNTKKSLELEEILAAIKRSHDSFYRDCWHKTRELRDAFSVKNMAERYIEQYKKLGSY